MNTTKLTFSALLIALVGVSNTWADIARDPIGVNVSAARPMSLTVRFADTNGGLFTTTEALFCYRLLDNGQCDPGTILGRLPSSRDRGSTRTPKSRITDVMTIPYSVIRSAVVRAQDVDYSDFYYVRRFTPQPGVDLGAGAGRDVFSRVTCHLAGPATVPLSLTHVSVYGNDLTRTGPVKLIRIDEKNLRSGQVEARVEHTGSGILQGWWEVRTPSDPRLKDIDRLPEAALSEVERAQRQRFTRLQRFRVNATTVGSVTIKGPRYSDLPRFSSGRHEILLRFDASPGRENRARLNVPGESLNLFSGAVAGFNIPVLEYQVPAGQGGSLSVAPLAARLIARTNETGDRRWALGWQPVSDPALVLEFSIESGGSQRSLIAPAMAGYVEFPVAWAADLPHPRMSVTLRGADDEVVGLRERVSY